MRKAKILGIAILIILMFASLAGAQYPGIIQGIIYSDADYSKINLASLNIGGVKVVLKNGAYMVTTSAGTFKINAKTGKIVKK